MTATLKAILELRPRCGWLENVPQMRHTRGDGDSGLEYVAKMLRDGGYMVGTVEIDLALFLQGCARRRWDMSSSVAVRATLQLLFVVV